LVRAIKGKENIKSLRSRFTLYSTKRNREKLIWIHAASVGESMIAINLVNQLKKKYQNTDFLITTGTLSSANLINKWLPPGVYHEFTPLDNIFTIRKFYQYWRPTVGIFVESDIWPVLVTFGAKKCKLILLNGRLSDKSFQIWQKFPKIFKLLTDSFSYIGVQSKVDLEKYQSLGCNKFR
jgi:3-deoxy-D-manno-octulosonic-acid transferase